MQFGSHLTIDGYGGDPVKLNDGELVTKVLDELPGLVGMKKLTPAQVVLAPESNPKDSGGYSGFVIIAESHISCHTFPGRHFVSIDVYTCKNDMNQDYIIDYFKTAFDLKDVEVNFIKRGTRFPESDF